MKDEGGRMKDESHPALRLPPLAIAAINPVLPYTPDVGNAMQRAAAGARQAFLRPLFAGRTHKIIERLRRDNAIQRAALAGGRGG